MPSNFGWKTAGDLLSMCLEDLEDLEAQDLLRTALWFGRGNHTKSY